MRMERHHYAEHFGPTVGDKIRLGDTELFAEIEKDHTVYGDEAIFGGGKVLRDGMGQSPTATRGQGTPDVVITNVVIVDYTGIVKADVAIRDETHYGHRQVREPRHHGWCHSRNGSGSFRQRSSPGRE